MIAFAEQRFEPFEHVGWLWRLVVSLPLAAVLMAMAGRLAWSAFARSLARGTSTFAVVCAMPPLAYQLVGYANVAADEAVGRPVVVDCVRYIHRAKGPSLVELTSWMDPDRTVTLQLVVDEADCAARKPVRIVVHPGRLGARVDLDAPVVEERVPIAARSEIRSRARFMNTRTSRSGTRSDFSVLEWRICRSPHRGRRRGCHRHPTLNVRDVATRSWLVRPSDCCTRRSGAALFTSNPLPTPPATPRNQRVPPVSNWIVTRWGRSFLNDFADAVERSSCSVMVGDGTLSHRAPLRRAR